jgi:hypothetical protein
VKKSTNEFSERRRILAAARRTDGPVMDDARLPRYLRRQQHEIPLRPEEMLA